MTKSSSFYRYFTVLCLTLTIEIEKLESDRDAAKEKADKQREIKEKETELVNTRENLDESQAKIDSLLSHQARFSC